MAFPMVPSRISTAISIKFLPHELLSIIFAFVYKASERDTALSRSSFPYALASVCTAWRDILSQYPEYWTRVVVFVNPFNPFDVRSSTGLKYQLKWSRENPISVQVDRWCNVAPQTIEGEYQAVRTIINLLKPHLERCSYLAYDLAYSSSLPLVTADINHTTNLDNLHFSCDVGNGIGGPRESIPSPASFCLPVLRRDFCSITLDGWNFVDLCRKVPRWSKHRGKGHLTLEIVHYSELDSSEEFWEGLAGVLRDVGELTLSHIEVGKNLVSDVRVLQYPRQCDLSLFLNKVNKILMNGVFDRINVMEYLDITDCAVATTTDGSCIWSKQLNLTEIPVTEDISWFLSRWVGQILYVSECPGFDDNVLDVLSRDYAEINDTERIIGILNCPNFTAAGLKRFVRRHLVKNPDIPLILNITGEMPALSEENRRWFKEKSKSFYWGPGPYGRR